MTECLCGARIGERHTQRCPLTGVRQPEPKMSGHPSVYRRPLMTVNEAMKMQHRLENLDGCDDYECDTCYGSPFASEDGHIE